MKFLSNIYDPTLPDAKERTFYSSQENRDEQWKDWLKWVGRNIMGRPKRTEFYSVEQLEAMGMVGLYAPQDEAEPPQKWALGEVDPICISAAEVVEKLQAENEKLRQVLGIVRRYASVEYGQSASCRMIVSEIQHAFPTPSILTISNPA